MKQIDFRNDILPLKDVLYRLALRITLDSAEAEDIVQETMLKLWNRRDRWDEIDSIEAFAMTICRNLALDHQKRADSQHASLDEVETLLSTPNNQSPTPFDPTTASKSSGKSSTHCPKNSARACNCATSKKNPTRKSLPSSTSRKNR